MCLINSYGSHSVVLLNKLHLPRRTQHKFISIAPYIYVTRFAPFSFLRDSLFP